MSPQNSVTQNVITTLVVTLLSLSATLSRGQDLEPLRPPSESPYSLEDLDDVFLQWPGTSDTNQYPSIDGRDMQLHIVEQQQISRRYRDTVNSQYWGRIIGASSDWDSATWLEEKFHDVGLSDVHVQPFDLTPQWFPQSWSVTVAAGGDEFRLATAHPFYRSEGTTSQGLDLELVYVGLGTEADFSGRAVSGKAVLVFTMLGLPEEKLRRAVIATIRHELGPIAVVGELNFVSMLPKTRSGKIMRRVLKAIILDRDPGDITTIEEEGSVDEARRAWH